MRELVRSYVPNVRGKVATMVVAMSLALVGSLGWTGFAELKDGHRVLWKSLTLGFQGMGLVSSAVLWGVAATTLRRDAKLLATAERVQVDTTLHKMTEAAALEMGIAADTNAPAPRDEMAMAKAWLEANRPAILPAMPVDSSPAYTPVAAPLTPSIPAWYEQMLGYPAVLIWGPQGSGKTSFATGLLRARQRQGFTVRVLDPHAAYGQWSGFEVVGAGMDYYAIDKALEQFADEVTRDYKRLANEPGFKPQKNFCVVAEEMTNWAEHCANSGKFFNQCLSDIRKVGKTALFLAHDRTLSALGGGGGAKKRDNGLMELQLFASDEASPKPQFRGLFKAPGKEPIPVDIPREFFVPEHDNPATTLKRIYNAPDAPEPLTEDDQETLDLINDLRAEGLTKKTEIIAEVWGANPGATREYQQASATYERLKPYFQ